MIKIRDDEVTQDFVSENLIPKSLNEAKAVWATRTSTSRFLYEDNFEMQDSPDFALDTVDLDPNGLRNDLLNNMILKGSGE